MKTPLIFLLLLSFISSIAQPDSEDKFSQEVATIFTPADGLPETVYSDLQIDESGAIFAISKEGMFRYSDAKWEAITKLPADIIKKKNELTSDVLSQENYQQKKYIGKKDGLYIQAKKKNKWIEIFPADKNYSWKLSNVNVLQKDNKGRLWFGSNEGVGYLQNGEWKLFTGYEGLPFKYFTSIEDSPNGDIWFGTKKGAIRADGENFYYRFSRRWLANDYVNDILVDNDGTAWFATNKGVSRIVFQSMTMEEKADFFTDQVETKHNRMGFICQNKLNVRFDADSWEPAISDNDGMYTAMYGAAQSFRYAVTGTEEAKKIAKRSFDACKWLVDITHEKGFPARVIIPIDWPEPVNEQYSHEYNIRKQKEDPFWKDINPRFPKSKDGKYRWKCDTSSDELAGHYFFYGV